MNTRISLLICALASTAAVSTATGQIVVTASPMTFTPGQPTTVVSLRFDTQIAYNLMGGTFTVEIGVPGASSSDTPVIQGVTSTSSIGPYNNVTLGNTSQTSFSRAFTLTWDQTPTASGFGAVFAQVTLDTSQVSSGSWPFQVTAFFDDVVEGSPEAVYSDPNPVNLTFSAVPEPEETMAVMAGLSLGLGWWLRRLRGRPGSAVSRNP